MNRKDRARKLAAARAHARRQDNRLAAETGVRASVWRRTLKEERRAARRAAA